MPICHDTRLFYLFFFYLLLCVGGGHAFRFVVYVRTVVIHFRLLFLGLGWGVCSCSSCHLISHHTRLISGSMWVAGLGWAGLVSGQVRFIVVQYFPMHVCMYLCLFVSLFVWVCPGGIIQRSLLRRDDDDNEVMTINDDDG